jgi:hypothetical protein
MTQSYTVGPVRASFDHHVAVAIPARNEALRIEACLAAMDLAAGCSGALSTVVMVLVNNSDDDTAGRARRTIMRNCTVIVEQVTLSPAHAGMARSAALDRAMNALPAGGVLLTTDADSEVAPDWIAANLAEIDAGADAVAGVVAFNAAARATLPAFSTDRALEWRLADLHARLGTLLDPLTHDPWPNHIWAWGASLAVTTAAYRAVGGMPAIPLAEDRAFAALLEAHDMRLRHSHAPVVFTSARQSGRAPGGFADLIRGYANDSDMPCDAALEPTRLLVRRLRRRARCRAEGASGFGARWAAIEANSPDLARRRLYPQALPAEVALASRLIAGLAGGEADRADTRVFAAEA